MSQSPYDPIQYQAPAASRVPTSVMVLGIIGIIFGALMVLCGPISLMAYFVDFGFPNPAIQSIRNNSAMKAWMVISQSVHWVTALLLLVGAIGSVLLKRWARKAMIVYAFATIVLTVVGMIVGAVWITPAMTQANAQAGMGGAGAFGEIVGIVFGFVWLIFPGCILYFYTRPQVIEAFEATQSEGNRM